MFLIALSGFRFLGVFGRSVYHRCLGRNCIRRVASALLGLTTNAFPLSCHEPSWV
jgi:hypothetical protein